MYIYSAVYVGVVAMVVYVCITTMEKQYANHSSVPKEYLTACDY